MFYHYQTLTERKYGIATVWLVATLGSRSTLSKKLQKKDILEVNLPKACETIIHPEAPLALRLQSNLLYGISRVYKEQCTYFHNDVQSAHLRLSKEFSTSDMHTTTIDLGPANAKSRSAALMLADDPAFVPGLAYLQLPLEFSDLDISRNDDVQDFVSMSSRTGNSRSISLVDDALIPTKNRANDIPSSSSRGMGYGPFDVYDEDDYPIRDNDGFIANPDFQFDEDGNLQDIIPHIQDDLDYPIQMETNEQESPSRNTNIEAANQPVDLDHVGLAHAQVLQDHAQAMGNAQLDDLNVPLPEYPDLDPVQMDTKQLENIIVSAEPDSSHGRESESEYRDSTSPRGSVEPAPKRKRKVKCLPIDQGHVTTLHSTEVARSMSDYLSNMQRLKLKKKQKHDALQAKLYAHEIVFGWSGKIESTLLSSKFSGHNVLKFFNKEASSKVPRKKDKGKKRASFVDADAASEDGSHVGRRVRPDYPGNLGPEMGLNRDYDDQYNDVALNYNEDVTNTNFDDIEIGRRASSQPDLSIMPWNALANNSRAGSVFSFGGGGGVPSSSVGGIPSTILRGRMPHRALSTPLVSPGIGPSRPRGISRARFSPSPMGAHGIPPNLGMSVFGDQEYPPMETAVEGEEFMPMVDDNGTLPGGTQLNTQEADHAWFTKLMEQEGQNFLEYIKDHVEKMDVNVAENDARKTIMFDNLLNPEQTNKVIAVQAFHHVLSLATRNMILVKQDKAFDDIQLTLLV